MKVSIMPLLIALLFLLVLSKASYSVESFELVGAASDDDDAIAAQGPMRNVTTIASIDYGIPMKQDGIHNGESRGEEKEDAVGVATKYYNDAQAAAATRNFQCTDHSTCKTLVCVGGPIYDLHYEFDYFLDWCGNKYFDVIIENCTFNQNTISRSTFSGSFKMSTLTIRNCTLDTIVDNAFNYQTLNKLTNLTFVGTQLKALNAQTFLGLETVENFQLFNVLKQETLPFSASNFLQPMAASLNNLVLQQREESCCSNIIHDPTEWLGGNSTTVYSKLTYVDLSGTNFNDALTGNTFAKLSAVQELRLANCSLSTIAENAFTGILSTLKSLDLRYNRLQTLDGELLAAAIPIGINMELGWNMWRCDCDNMEIIEYLKQIKNNSAADTVCATPTELQGTQIRFAQVICDGRTTLTTIMTTLTSIEATKTIAVEMTTIKVTTTDYTTREPTEPISQATSTSSTNTITTSPLPTSITDITPTTGGGKTEGNTDSTTTISADLTFPTSSSTTNITPTTTGDSSEETTETTECNSETPSTSSTTPNKNATLSTSSPTTSIKSTTSDSTIINTTESHSETSSTFSTTANDNTTFPTLSTSSSTTIIMPTTSDDSAEETTVSTSSGAVSIHRW
ncbi:serine-rich adhesin for platelets-like [Bactrocera neohumeralis]|uniref:serine-rich adhesin for platelets-like n=1 Tax=Bactrocera neohumeralis TaxID=98809 RepID=UPI00216601CF|nr:serine-rich adhesin for platelets-like [Bactrocera neohumeralis]